MWGIHRGGILCAHINRVYKRLYKHSCSVGYADPIIINLVVQWNSPMAILFYLCFQRKSFLRWKLMLADVIMAVVSFCNRGFAFSFAYAFLRGVSRHHLVWLLSSQWMWAALLEFFSYDIIPICSVRNFVTITWGALIYWQNCANTTKFSTSGFSSSSFLCVCRLVSLNAN